jgi:predicted AAA+ superfamily ATPase
MYKRQMAAAIEKAGQYFPIITILGPRHSGKTTIAQTLYPEKPYINLERLDVRMQALEDPNRFIRQFPNGAIFDEIQEAPALLSYLMVFVDEIKKTTSSSLQEVIKQNSKKVLANLLREEQSYFVGFL